jgi:hypothetical protein
MVAPCSINLEILLRQTFLAETKPADQFQAAIIIGLNVSLEAMESEIVKCMVEHQAYAFCHLAVPSMAGIRIETQVCGLQRSRNGLIQIHDADQATIGEAADEQAKRPAGSDRSIYGLAVHDAPAV